MFNLLGIVDRAGRWLAIGFAALVALLMAKPIVERIGARKERNRATEKDRSRANEIRDAVDAARRGGGLQPDDRGYRD